MGKTKSLLMDDLEQFYSQSNELLTSSEYEQIATNGIVALAHEMNLYDYLGGYTSIESMVSEAWYDVHYEHVAV